MKKTFLYVTVCLLCVLLCLGLSFMVADVAYAADNQPSGISIQVSLPDGWTAESTGESETRYYGTLSTTDNQAEAGSGKEIIVNGKRYTSVSGGSLNVSLKKLGCTPESDSVQEGAGAPVDTAAPASSDTAGPADTSDASKQPEMASGDDAAAGTDTAEPSDAPADSEDQEPDTGTSDDAQNGTGLTPDGQGTVVDNTASEGGKQFYTVYTQDDNVFYLIIDNERDSDNVYFLDTVKESDLLSLSEKDTDTQQSDVVQSAIPDPEPVCTCADKCAPGEVDTNCPVCVLSWRDCAGKDAAPAPEPEKSGNNTMLLVLIAMAAVGGAGYYFKIYKPKKDLDDADDFDDLTGEDEETVNEDEEPAPVRGGSGEEPEEPEYPSGYGYEEPEYEE